MSARDNIFGRIAAARGGRTGDPDPDAHIRAHARGPVPKVDEPLAARFQERAQRLASDVAACDAIAQVPRVVAQYLESHQLPGKAVCWPALGTLPWREAGIAVEARATRGDDLVGITGAFCAIAETGTLMLLSGAPTPAAVSLLPETHVAVVEVDRIVATMEDAWDRLRAERGEPPRAVNFVSGPSRTADIEQTVTLGAHGPYRVLIVLVNRAST